MIGFRDRDIAPIRFICMIAMLAPAIQAAEAQAPRPLGLKEAVREALAHHAAIEQSAHNAAASASRVTEARAGAMPSISLQAAATAGPTGAPVFGPPGLQGLVGDPLKSHYAGALNILLPLYDFGRTQHLVAAREELLQSARGDVDTQRSIVSVGVEIAYLNVLRRQELVKVFESNIRQREATVAEAKLYVEGGLRAEVDLRLAEANLAEAKGQLLDAENDVHLAFAQLNNAMGETRLTEYILAPFSANSTSHSSDEALRTAVSQRPELKSAASLIRAGAQSELAARSELMPRIDTIASVGALNPGKLISENKNYAVGLAVTFPLYTGGAAEGRILEERNKRLAAESALRNLQEAVKLQAAQAWLAVRNRENQLTVAEAQSAAARSSQQQASERYRLQLSTLEELLAAESAAVRAETQRVSAVYDLQQAHAELDWAIGIPPVSSPATPSSGKKP